MKKQKRKANKFWKSWKNTENELKRAIKKNNGEFPTQRRLSKMKMQSIKLGIRYHGGTTKIRERMGYRIIRKDPLIYENWNTFEDEMKRAIKENNGEFPNSKRFCEMKKSFLNRAISYHGGFPMVRRKMGYDSARNPIGYNKEWVNIKRDLGKAIKENNGEFPTQERLAEIGYGYLIRAIAKHHGGIRRVRKKMGCDMLKNIDGYYKKWINFKKDIIKVIKQNNGEFPTQRILTKLKMSSLSHYAVKYYGGLNMVRKKMGYDINKKPKDYWRDWTNTKRELERVIEENNGIFPTQERLMEMKKSSLINAIYYHGGSPQVRERIGYHEQKRQELARKLEKIIMEI